MYTRLHCARTLDSESDQYLNSEHHVIRGIRVEDLDAATILVISSVQHFTQEKTIFGCSGVYSFCISSGSGVIWVWTDLYISTGD